MRRIKFYGAEQEEVVEFDDNISDREINKAFYLWLDENVDYGWLDMEKNEECAER